MIKRKKFACSFGVLIMLAGCAGQQYARPLPMAPFGNMRLNSCTTFGSNIVECQMEYWTGYSRHWLGPVQQEARAVGWTGKTSWYQVSTCWPMQRVSEQLPIYLCSIYDPKTGMDAGSVFLKGGTAVNLAKILGDPEQLHYRWQRDVWSRVDG